MLSDDYRDRLSVVWILRRNISGRPSHFVANFFHSKGLSRCLI